MAPFAYEPLSEGEFRLLTLHCGDKEGPIYCTLSNTEFELAESYWALSYVWDQKPRSPSAAQNSTNVIYVNFQEIPVKWNLVSALSHIREIAENDRVLWIDAVCINQEDLDEKNKQLAIMGNIYRRSERVHAWLGEGDDDSDHIMRQAISMGNDYMDLWSPHSIDGVPTGLSSLGVQSKEDFAAKRQAIFNSLVVDTEALYDLIHRPYWERLWIVQEVGLGSLVVLQCGYITIPWEYFGVLCDSVDQEHINQVDNLDFNSGAGDIDVVSQLRKRIRPLQFLRAQWHNMMQFHDINLLGMTQKFRDWGCFMDIDHIFALHGLLGEDDARKNQPDYNLGVNEVFGRLVISYAETHGRLDGLNCHTGEHSLNLRSWIPDFSSKNNMHSLISTPAVARHWLHAPKKLFAAAGDTAPEVSMDSTCNLIVMGIQFDRVAEIGAIFPLGEMPAPGSEEFDIWGEAVSMTFNSWIPGVYGLANFGNAVLRTLHADTTLVGRTAGGFDAPDEYVSDSRATNMTFIWKANRNRRPICTQKGYIGLGPQDVLPGDIICIFGGGQTPYVIRELEDLPSYFQFVGECYVHGIMEGEALEQMDYENREPFFLI